MYFRRAGRSSGSNLLMQNLSDFKIKPIKTLPEFMFMSLSSELTKIILSIVKENFESDYNVLLKSGLLEFLLNQLDWIKLIYF